MNRKVYLLAKEYDDDSIADAARDIYECFDPGININAIGLPEEGVTYTLTLVAHYEDKE